MDSCVQIFMAVATIIAALAAAVSAIIAARALSLNRRAAEMQIKVLEQEWRPYLALENPKIDVHTNPLYFHPVLHLRNVGKCILRYKEKKFDIRIGLICNEPVKSIHNSYDRRTSGEIGINSVIKHIGSLYASPGSPITSKSIIIDFEIEYYRPDEDTPQTKYYLADIVCVNYDSAGNVSVRYIATEDEQSEAAKSSESFEIIKDYLAELEKVADTGLSENPDTSE